MGCDLEFSEWTESGGYEAEEEEQKAEEVEEDGSRGTEQLAE